MTATQHHDSERDDPRLDTLADWLVDQSLRDTSLEEIFEGTCQRLYAAGVPISHSRVTFRTLHPLYRAQSLRWQRNLGLEVQSYAHAATSEQWQRTRSLT